MPRTALDDFHNRLRIMIGIDAHEFVAAGLTREQWQSFDTNPYRFFIRADVRTALAIWSILEARTNKQVAA